MKSKDTNNEINILEIILILWKNKLNFALILVVPLILIFLFYHEKDADINKTLVKTEIITITHYEEGRYKIFNSYIESVKRVNSSNGNFRSSEQLSFKDNEFVKKSDKISSFIEVLVDQEDMDNLLIDNIDKHFLFNLFIDKLKQDNFLFDLVKRSDLIEEKNYVSSEEYNKAVTNIVSQIDIFAEKMPKSQAGNKIFIQFETQDLKKWEKFLNLVEKEANRQIQKNLLKMIDDYIFFLQKIRSYKIQDVDFLISISSLEHEIIDLMKAKKILLNTSEYIRRIKYVYSQSPFSTTDEFHAAKINYNGSNFLKVNSSSPTKAQVFIVTGIFSVIFGIFFVMMLNAIKNRK